MIKTISALSISALTITGCSTAQGTTEIAEVNTQVSADVVSETNTKDTVSETTTTSKTSETSFTSTSEGSLLEVSEMFTDRDLEQVADLTEATYLELASNSDLNITEAGVYVISGQASNSTIKITADGEDKVQLVLDQVSITNESAPAIYVVSADKVFVTTTDSDNDMTVTSAYDADGETNLDAVIFSKSDLTLNGVGNLDIISDRGNGITSKDDLKITGGSYLISADDNGIEANDSIRLYDGYLDIASNSDAIHSENDDDLSLGYIYIAGGTVLINAADDAIRATSIIQIDGGIISVNSCTEGIEATSIQINGGIIDVYASDDGINATSKSDYEVFIEVNGGDITVEVASGDTDAFDANGDIIVNGGSIDITAPTSSFDADGTAVLNDGQVTVNGELITEIVASQGGRNKR